VTFDSNIVVHCPQAVTVEDRAQPRIHEQGKPSAGFRGLVYLRPTNVSFRTLEWHEGQAKATVGSDDPGNPGYFVFDQGKEHAPSGLDLSNLSNTRPFTPGISGGDITSGCRVDQIDRIYSGFNSDYPNNSTNRKNLGRPTNVNSWMRWEIPWEYKARKTDPKKWVQFQIATHEARMDTSSGTVTISKAGATVSCQRDAPTSGLP
jgi:hypothetical protein